MCAHLAHLTRHARALASTRAWAVEVSLRRRGQGLSAAPAAEVVVRTDLVPCLEALHNPQSSWLRFRLPAWVTEPLEASFVSRLNRARRLRWWWWWWWWEGGRGPGIC